MKKGRKPRLNGVSSLITLLFLVACVLGIAAQHAGEKQFAAPRARYEDASPLGGKGFRLLLLRLGYEARVQDEKLSAMPPDARVWVLLDPATRFNDSEGNLLLKWVRGGGTLIWACAPSSDLSWNDTTFSATAHSFLRRKLSVEASSYFTPASSPLPTLTPLTRSSAAQYWNGVKSATASADVLKIGRPFLELAGTPVGTELARISLGRGQIFVMPDALIFTNYALSKPDNAVLVTNLIRLHTTSGTVYFDQRDHKDRAKNGAADAQSDGPPTIFDYLWRAPLRWAVLQTLGALLLWWALAGRRLGAPVPLPEAPSVTRASQFAQAMGALFQKAQRPQAVARTLGDTFRRETTRRVGLSLDASDELIAERVAQATGLPAPMIDRLLLRAKVPADNENMLLRDAQEMEIVLRALRGN